MKNLFVKLLDKKAILPRYAHETDSGLDLFSIEEVTLFPFRPMLVKTGIIIELPEDTEAQIRPRSGLALNNCISILNSPGTIDNGYRGEIGVILINLGREEFVIKEGMKIAQLVIKPILHVNVIQRNRLSDTPRGNNGFGSTG